MTTPTAASAPTIVIAGGGTAGHIEPALAVGEVLRDRYGFTLAALGTPKGLEGDIIPARGVELHLITPVPIPRKPSVELARLPLKLGRAVSQTRKILQRSNAAAVFGTGGYVAAPAYLAAKSLGLPFYVLETNALAGMANKLGVRLGGVGFNAHNNSGMPGEVVGIPVRPGLGTDPDGEHARRGRRLWGLRDDLPTVLVTGGSQGAASINAAISAAAPELTKNLQILHAYGKKNPKPRVDSENYIAVPYIDDMAAALAVADLVVCRSGAMTVAEVTAAGLPAIYIPLPHGNGEQALNAQELVAAGAALMIDDAAADSTTVRSTIETIMGEGGRLAQMAQAVAAQRSRSSADLIAARIAGDLGCDALPDPTLSADLLDRVHMVGIGGSGMSGLARILLSRGAQVTGSDIKESTPVEMLRAMGATIAIGHEASNIELGSQPPSVVVTSFAAIAQDNPELVAATEAGIPIIRRSDLLALLMAGRTQVLLAGTHGKTSTTSMTVAALQAVGVDPSFAIGGQLNRAGTNAHHGTGEIFVAEADESDASLLTYEPAVAVVTTIEPDHLDYFGSAEAYYQVFDDFAARIAQHDGTLIVCLDDDGAARLGLRAVERSVRTIGYGTAAAAERYPEIPWAARLEAEEVRREGTDIAATIVLDDAAGNPQHHSLRTRLHIPGHHMVLNALGAVLAALYGLPEQQREAALPDIARGLAEFSGVRRRFEYRGTRWLTEQSRSEDTAGIRVYDDYAHHPTEVAAVLQAARTKVAAEGHGARVIACFQPHLYSRTMEFDREFAQALSLADAAVVLDIYGAREQPVEGITSRIITDKISLDPEVVRYEPDFSAAAATVVDLARPGDLILTLGAGSVTLLAAEILDEISARAQQTQQPQQQEEQE